MVRPQFTPQQRAFMVKEYHDTKSVPEVLRRFRQQFRNVRCPSRATVFKNVNKYKATGTSRNLNKEASGRRRTGRSAANIQAVRNVLDQRAGGRISARRNGLGLPPATFNRITRLDLRYHPYQMIRRHELLPGDPPRRQRFCEWLLQQPANFLEDLVIGDESGFTLNGMVNTHNIREYRPQGQRPLNFDYQRRDDRHKLTVWVGLVGNGSIVGPYFFRNNINGDDYLRMLNENVVGSLRRIPRFRLQRNGRLARAWWAQDGAPPHRRRTVTDRLTELFGDHVIALNRRVEWPPRSPDLTPLDFFLWGHLKSKVYVTPPRDLDDIEQRIRAEVNILRRDRGMIRRAVQDMRRRAQLCIQRNGGHVED